MGCRLFCLRPPGARRQMPSPYRHLMMELPGTIVRLKKIAERIANFNSIRKRQWPSRQERNADQRAKADLSSGGTMRRKPLQQFRIRPGDRQFWLFHGIQGILERPDDAPQSTAAMLLPQALLRGDVLDFSLSFFIESISLVQTQVPRYRRLDIMRRAGPLLHSAGRG